MTRLEKRSKVADETRTPRTPEDVAAEAWAIAKTPNMARDWGEERIAALIREERRVAFAAGADAGQQAERAEQPLAKVLVFLADRQRLAVEGRSDG